MAYKDFFDSRDYCKVFDRKGWKEEYAFRKTCFQEWKSGLKVGQEIEVIRPNHTRTNNSAKFFNLGVLPIVAIKDDEVVFLKGNRKLHYTVSDFTYHTSELVRKKASELFWDKEKMEIRL